eukprot:TRINITY_DN31942_c0_g1_i1.p1 TRINITY_DN31942_c0_g1~~TRINITY_DN31942_c0_g1_i1.p1  ORF type:complete len:436 (+),score=61.50 TRINITY_DN31942_c0_g1_i1:83-1390(+)
MDRIVQLFMEAIAVDGTTVVAPSWEATHSLPPLDFGTSSTPAENGGKLGVCSLDAGVPTHEQVERGLVNLEALLTSEDAEKLGMGFDDTVGVFMLLATGLERDPRLNPAAICVYEACLDRQRVCGWERCVILHRLSLACLKTGRLRDAEKWLTECATLVVEADGNPKDEILFGGAVSSRLTRREFAATVEKLRCKVYHDLGDSRRAREHFDQAKRLSEAFSGDVIEKRFQTVEQSSNELKKQASTSETASTTAICCNVKTPSPLPSIRSQFNDTAPHDREDGRILRSVVSEGPAASVGVIAEGAISATASNHGFLSAAAVSQAVNVLEAATAAVYASKATASAVADLPPWVVSVGRRHTSDAVDLLVQLAPTSAGAPIEFTDLELNVSVAFMELRLRLRGAAACVLQVPEDTVADGLTSKWRRKRHLLELHFPRR